jgi:hypothetical protein
LKNIIASDMDLTEASQFYSRKVIANKQLHFNCIKCGGIILNLLTSWEWNCKIVLTSMKTIGADLIPGRLATNKFRVLSFHLLSKYLNMQ